jgi:hypothetical protein
MDLEDMPAVSLEGKDTYE